MAERAFNALNGKEIETILLREVKEKLALEDRFDRAVEVSSVSFTFTLKFEELVQPLEFVLQVSKSFKAPAGKGLPIAGLRETIYQAIAANMTADQRFAQHVAYPKPTWNHRLVLEILVLNGDGRAREVSVGEEPVVAGRMDLRALPKPVAVAPIQEPAPDPWGHQGFIPSKAPEPTSRPTETFVSGSLPDSQFVTDASGRRFKLVPADDVEPEGEYITRHIGGGGVSRKVDMTTGTGLPIEARFAPSPGVGFAESSGMGSPVAVASGTGKLETIEIGLEHPSLANGGVGAADAVRREHGLPVPMSQAGRAHSNSIVDLPADGF